VERKERKEKDSGEDLMRKQRLSIISNAYRRWIGAQRGKLSA